MFTFFQDIEEDFAERILDSTIRAQTPPSTWKFDDTIMPPSFGDQVIDFFTMPNVLAIMVLIAILIALASFIMHFIMPVKVSVSVSKADGAGGVPSLDTSPSAKGKTVHITAPVEATPGVILPVKVDGYSKGGDPCLWGADGRHIATIHFPEKYVRRVVDLINGPGTKPFTNVFYSDRRVTVNDATIYVLEYLDDECTDRSEDVTYYIFKRLSGREVEDPSLPPKTPDLYDDGEATRDDVLGMG